MTYSQKNAVLQALPDGIQGIHTEVIAPVEPFLQTARRFAHLPGTTLLMSGGGLDCARYHMLAIQPWLTVCAAGLDLTITTNGTTFSVRTDPLEFVQLLLKRYRYSLPDQTFPLTAGLLGYLAYDLKDLLEKLPRTSVDDLQLPHLFLSSPSILVVRDRHEKVTRVHLPRMDKNRKEVEQRLAAFKETLAAPMPPVNNADATGNGFTSGFSRTGYMSAVETIRDYIVRGHVYQVNMSQRFASTFQGDPFTLFAAMFAENPAPFFAFIQAGNHQVVSTSPERFVLLDGKTVETRPIKGTRPRGRTPAEDHRMKSALESSPKDDAELSMIVDLLRNDIGKVCRAGTVQVTEHKRLEAYENVYHLVSIVNGILDDGLDAVDLIRATFPGGSITGCPKIRAMEIIDELEPVRRHIYTGAIGYLSFHDTMDLSIAIRTATIVDKKILFSVGGGIVYDSDPEDEFAETLHKGRTIMNALPPSKNGPQKTPRLAWCNGIFKPLTEVTVSVEHEGFLYGYGFFETIRVKNGAAAMLNEHLHRFNRTWGYCFSSPPPDVSWDEIIRQLIIKNNLADKTAAVKILAAAGTASAEAFDGTLLVTARAYFPRLSGTARSGLCIAVYPHTRHTHLAAHKSMNYMFYKMAGRWAMKRSADEALILNADKTVSETNTANIFCVFGKRVCRPLSKHVLPGTMEKAVRRLLSQWGYSVEERQLSVNDLKGADQVFLTNALMGAIPVTAIDGETVENKGGLCEKLNAALL